MYLAIVFFPLFSFLIVMLFGRYLGHKGAAALTTGILGVCFLISILIFYEVGIENSKTMIPLFPWILSGILNLNWCLFFDSLTATMLVVVTLVSFLVHIYSIEYMGEDPHLARFMAYLSLFTFFMLFLVTSNNYVQLFLGWEGVGLASYLLINFWFTRLQANKSALKAVIVNRFGDLSFTLALLLMYFNFGSFDFSIIFSTVHLISQEDIIQIAGYDFSVIFLISLFLSLAAVGKSAQIFLHTWLPDAMEGPTPVSALIHAATMVTAGVFLLLRSSPILEYCPDILFFISIIGALTSFFAATSGAFQQDLKKVIAYSTCSQLGYMVFALGLSNYSVSIFHLMNHAFFKALLFLSAGSVIHALSNEQDLRKMGGLFKILPFTYICILIGSLALMGFPFLTGFYSKDVILELAYANYTVSGEFVYWLGIFSAFFTSFYSFRLLYLAFFGVPNGFKFAYKNVHDAPLLMFIPMFILALFSIFIGYVLSDMYVGIGSNFWNGVFVYNLDNFRVIDSEFLPVIIKHIPFIFTLIGSFVGYFLYAFVWDRYKYLIFSSSFNEIKFNQLFRNLYVEIYTFFSNKWYFDTIYNKYFVSWFMLLSYEGTFKAIDRGLIETIGPLGGVRSLEILSKFVSKLHSGLVFKNIFYMVVGMCTILGSVYILDLIIIH